MVRQWQQFFYGGRYVGDAASRSPDFVKLAEAHGLVGPARDRARADRRRRRGGARGRRARSSSTSASSRKTASTRWSPAGADLHDMIRRPSPIVETSDSMSDHPGFRPACGKAAELPSRAGYAHLHRLRRGPPGRPQPRHVAASGVATTTSSRSPSVAPSAPGVSRMTVVLEADEDAARRIEANLYKLVNVLCVEDTTRAADARARARADQGARGPVDARPR